MEINIELGFSSWINIEGCVGFVGSQAWFHQSYDIKLLNSIR